MPVNGDYFRSCGTESRYSELSSESSESSDSTLKSVDFLLIILKTLLHFLFNDARSI